MRALVANWSRPRKTKITPPLARRLGRDPLDSALARDGQIMIVAVEQLVPQCVVKLPPVALHDAPHRSDRVAVDRVLRFGPAMSFIEGVPEMMPQVAGIGGRHEAQSEQQSEQAGDYDAHRTLLLNGMTFSTIVRVDNPRPDDRTSRPVPERFAVGDMGLVIVDYRCLSFSDLQ